MSFFSLFRTVRFFVFGSIAILALSAPLRAQDLRKWMPNVGDTFFYQQKHHVHYATLYDISDDDTMKLIIDSIKSSSDTTPIDLVFAHHVDKMGDGENSFWFTPADSIISDHSFVIISDEVGYWSRATNGAQCEHFDFSKSQQFEDTIMGQPISSYSSGWCQPLCFSGIGSINCMATYSRDLRWFLSFQGWDTGTINYAHPSTYSDEEWTDNLLYVIEPNSSVKQESISHFSCSFSDGFLSLTGVPSLSIVAMIDPLGRIIHSWQLPKGDRGRQISLNVTDVPSGMYFLRVLGTGFDEVKKVMITH